MRNLTDFAILHEYERIKKLGDKLVEIGGRIDWDGFRQKLDVFIQQLYSLSDEQLERELADGISFRVFLGTTEVVPDSTTLGKFR